MENTMPHALIINGAEIHDVPAAGAKFNTMLSTVWQQELRVSYTILTTTVSAGYSRHEEQQKFLLADVIIFQFPVFWFAVPAGLKRYLDDVYEPGVFFGHSKEYGRGGLLTGKRYLMSTTWNAKLSDFDTELGFLGKHMPDDILAPFHLTQQYVGLKRLASFSEHDVIRHPDPAGAANRLQQHISQHLL